MDDPNSTVCRVNMLPSSSAGSFRFNPQVFGVNSEGDLWMQYFSCYKHEKVHISMDDVL